MWKTVKMYVAMIVAMVVQLDLGYVRLYREQDHRLSMSSTSLTVWYTQSSLFDYSTDLVYVDIPRALIRDYELATHGQYRLKDHARRYSKLYYRQYRRLLVQRSARTD